MPIRTSLGVGFLLDAAFGERRLRVTRGKAQSEYMCSELPQLADITRSTFNQITRPGSEQFHARLWLNNATRLSGMEWLWSAKRALVWVTGGTCRPVNQENPPMRIYIIGNAG